MKINTKKIKAIVGTYLALAVPAVLATAMTGHTDPATLVAVGAAAVLAPIARGMNPKDPAFGIVKEVNDKVQEVAAEKTATK